MAPRIHSRFFEAVTECGSLYRVRRNRRPNEAFRASFLVAIAVTSVLQPGCGKKGPPQAEPSATGTTHQIEAGPEATSRIQEVLILAKPGDTIRLGAGTYAIDGTLSLDVPRVSLRGEGPDRTILSFQGQEGGGGGEGLLVTSDQVEVAELAIEDARGDGLKIQGATDVTIRHVRAEWTGGPKETNGGYGIYPVECRHVLVEHCTAIGASDSGIYLGQSTSGIIRNNTVHTNVAGIEIENSVDVDVYENEVTGNAGGILVFSLPNLPAGPGHTCRVFNNRVVGNNHPNFAPQGNIVASVPSGTGIMVMAFDQVEIFGNTVRDHQTMNVGIISYLTTGRRFEDPKFDPYPEAIHVHDNELADGGHAPSGKLGAVLGPLVGGQFPDIVYDGLIDSAKCVDGRLPDSLQLAIHDNGAATFINFDLANFDPLAGKTPKISRDLGPHDVRLPPLPAVQLEQQQ